MPLFNFQWKINLVNTASAIASNSVLFTTEVFTFFAIIRPWLRKYLVQSTY